MRDYWLEAPDLNDTSFDKLKVGDRFTIGNHDVPEWASHTYEVVGIYPPNVKCKMVEAE